jgi:hypothetical protein
MPLPNDHVPVLRRHNDESGNRKLTDYQGKYLVLFSHLRISP